MVARGLVLCAAVAGGAGCGGAGFPSVVSAEDVSAGGSPRVERVRDLGSPPLPSPGQALSGEGDGVAGPGELLLVEGSGFGKAPSVSVGGRPAEIVARTGGGGVVVRVGAGTPIGAQPVMVTVGGARGSLPFPMRRLGVALREEQLVAFELGAEAVKAIGAPVPVGGARAVRISADGSCAYVLTRSSIQVVDLTAAGGPRLARSLELGLDAALFTGADRAPLLFAVGEGSMQVVEPRSARTLARFPVSALPDATRGAARVESSPDGRTLAFLVPEGNHLVLVDISAPTSAKVLADLPLVPATHLPPAVDLRFSSDGQTLYVLLGDHEASLAAGAQPTQLVVVKLRGEPDAATAEAAPSSAPPAPFVFRTTVLSGVGAPVRLAMPRFPPAQTGTTIELGPERAPVRFSAVDRSASATDAPTGSVEQGDLTGDSGHVVQSQLLLGSVDVAPDGALYIAAIGKDPLADSAARWFGIAMVALGPPATLRFTPLTPAGAADLKPPYFVGEVRVQP